MKIDSIDLCVCTTRHVAPYENSPGRVRLPRLCIDASVDVEGGCVNLSTMGGSCKENLKPIKRMILVSNEINFLSAICPRQSEKRARKVT